MSDLPSGSRTADSTRAPTFDHFVHELGNALAASLGRVELLERHVRRGSLSRDDTLASLAIAADQIRRAASLVSAYEVAQSSTTQSTSVGTEHDPGEPESYVSQQRPQAQWLPVAPHRPTGMNGDIRIDDVRRRVQDLEIRAKSAAATLRSTRTLSERARALSEKTRRRLGHDPSVIGTVSEPLAPDHRLS